MQALDGIRVIDLTHALAGPYCTRQLALCGAEVIKVERPKTGDEFREYSPTTFAAANSGKRSITLDLKSIEGRNILDELIKTADILIENLRPGSGAGLGLDWERLKGLNSRLIFCSITGFGQTGELRDMPAIEWSVQAMTGINSMYVEEEDDPQRLGISILDPFAGYMGFAAILAALLQRQKTGIGQRVDVGMFDAGWVLCGPAVSELLVGDVPLAMTRRPQAARYRAKDRRIFISLIHDKWFETFCELASAVHLKRDPRFGTRAARLKNAAEFVSAVESCLSLHEAGYWESELTKRGVPASAIRSIVEVAASKHVKDRQLLHEVKLAGSERTLPVVGAGFRFEHGQPDSSVGPPALGESTHRILREIGLPDNRIEELRTRGIV